MQHSFSKGGWNEVELVKEVEIEVQLLLEPNLKQMCKYCPEGQ